MRPIHLLIFVCLLELSDCIVVSLMIKVDNLVAKYKFEHGRQNEITRNW